MRVLIVSDAVNASNLFVAILCKAIHSHGIDIHCSVSDFWKTTEKYDIIHFQWPDEVIGWNCKDESMIERLKVRVDELKSQGSRFIYTRHNTRPHNGNRTVVKAYKIIEACSDLIVHMGNYSYNEFLKQYPYSNNIIILHHIYEDTYNETISQEDARRQLGIPTDSFVITAFGGFRNWHEINMVLRAFLRLKVKNKFLLASRMLPIPYHPKCSNLAKYLLHLIGHNIIIPVLHRWMRMCVGSRSRQISDDNLPLYLIACDIVLIQRKQILNSGNVPLAFLFKKIVVGPETGNVKELLQRVDNPTFNPNQISSIVNAIESASTLSQLEYGVRNYIYAKQYFNLQRVGDLYADAYRKIIEIKP